MDATPNPPTPPPASPMSMAPLPSLSVIIPAYNDLARVIRCLRSLVQTLGETAQQHPALKVELLVQDDASPDVDLRELLGPPAQVARNERNLGFAGNCNAGAARAQGELLLFLNQDTVARPGWFVPLASAFDDPAVGIVGPKLIFGQNVHGATEDSIQSCGGLFDGGKGPFHRFIGYAADAWMVNRRERVSWTTGAALAIRRELFVKLGGFDEGYKKGYFEDTALCMAVRQAGHEIWYEPAACFEHAVGTTGAADAASFKANSLRFHQQWDAKIEPDTQYVHVAY